MLQLNFADIELKMVNHCLLFVDPRRIIFDYFYLVLLIAAKHGLIKPM